MSFLNDLGCLNLRIVEIPDEARKVNNDHFEQVTRAYFESLGYTVERLDARRKEIEKGAPDYFVHTDIEGFYVEVKNIRHSTVHFTISQIRWLLKYREEIPIVIAIPKGEIMIV